jgi:DNA-binding FadR family transcriptional regulator
LQVRHIIVARRGWKGGVFVAPSQSQIPSNTAPTLIEQCQAVYSRLEPLLLIEAAKTDNAAAVSELRRLADNDATSVAQPEASLRSHYLLYRYIVAIGLNTVLANIYATLLALLERAMGTVDDL